MHEEYHVHSHLAILLNGEPQAIPNDLGIVNDDTPDRCIYALHTHDNTGIIHVEAPAVGTFTLGQFFDIWGRPLTNVNLAGLEGMPIVVYITDPDGVVVKVPDDQWKDIELKSHRLITIQVGSPITEIPNFTWTGS